MWTLEIVFKRQKTSAEGHSKTLSQSDLVFINPGIYLHSMATVIEKSAKKQFPAYVGKFWSMSQRLLEIIISTVWRQWSRKVPKSNFRPTWANSGACHSVCWRYIADFMKTWSMKITAVLLKPGQTRVIISPMSPKITAKREKRAREREREKKDYQQSLVFIVWTLEIVFKRQKTSAEGHSKTAFSDLHDLVFINPGIYLHSMATVIEKSAKKQFPAYVGMSILDI